MPLPLFSKTRWLRAFRSLWCILSLLWVCLSMEPAIAGPLQDRMIAFPDWNSPPPLQRAKDDLYYPSWLEGEWQVSSTLVDIQAPLAPDIVTPGYASQQSQLGQPTQFTVRFSTEADLYSDALSFPFPDLLKLMDRDRIVADRTYNGTHITEALLGPDALQSLKIDPQNPNRQLAKFQNGQQLLTTISDRSSENVDLDTFISSELYQQEFRGNGQIYFNRVENTISYLRQPDQSIQADQITAIYLSPQDPDYFQASDRPVALYRYDMVLTPLDKSALSEPF